MKKKENFDLEYILYGERSPGYLGLIGQFLAAIFKYLLVPHKLNIGDARRLKDVYQRTGVSFPLKSERINKK